HADLSSCGRRVAADAARCPGFMVPERGRAASPAAPRRSAEQLAVLHEAAAVGHLVVELHRVDVGLMGEPPDARAAHGGGPLVDMLDQRPPDTLRAPAAVDEQVLQVAVVAG